MRARLGGLALFAFAVSFGASSGLSSGAAQAQDAGAAPAAKARVAYANYPRHHRARARTQTVAGGKYFIEFRSRYALSYGHTYATFGRLNAQGQIVQSEVAGLHPAGDSSFPWMVGHIVPVPSETGPSDGDLEEKYVSARYRVTMGEAEYNKVVAKIRQMQASTPLWSATLYNCNSFVGDIARFMGLSSNTSTLQVPPAYIEALRRINNGQASIAPGAI